MLTVILFFLLFQPLAQARPSGPDRQQRLSLSAAGGATLVPTSKETAKSYGARLAYALIPQGTFARADLGLQYYRSSDSGSEFDPMAGTFPYQSSLDEIMLQILLRQIRGTGWYAGPLAGRVGVSAVANSVSFKGSSMTYGALVGWEYAMSRHLTVSGEAQLTQILNSTFEANDSAGLTVIYHQRPQLLKLSAVMTYYF